jgi:hypothetical protein
VISVKGAVNLWKCTRNRSNQGDKKRWQTEGRRQTVLSLFFFDEDFSSPHKRSSVYYTSGADKEAVAKPNLVNTSNSIGAKNENWLNVVTSFAGTENQSDRISIPSCRFGRGWRSPRPCCARFCTASTWTWTDQKTMQGTDSGMEAGNGCGSTHTRTRKSTTSLVWCSIWFLALAVTAPSSGALPAAQPSLSLCLPPWGEVN